MKKPVNSSVESFPLVTLPTLWLLGIHRSTTVHEPELLSFRYDHTFSFVFSCIICTCDTPIDLSFIFELKKKETSKRERGRERGWEGKKNMSDRMNETF